MSNELIEARCPSLYCSKTHWVKAEDGTVTDTALCPPSSKHRNWVRMTPGAAQVAAQSAVRTENR